MDSNGTNGKRRPPTSQLQRGQGFKTMKLYQKPVASDSSTASFSESKVPCLVLHSLNDTFETKTIQLPFLPDVVRIGRQTNKSTLPGPENGYFDNKVMSRTHAEVWANENGRACIKDVKSSNGTFVNGIRLSKENEESGARELLPGDTLELGIDILNDDNGSILHRKVSARVDHAGYALDNHGALPPSQEKKLNGATNGNYARLKNGDRRIDDKFDVNGFSGANNAVQSSLLLGTGRQSVSIDMIIRKLQGEIKKSKDVGENLKRMNGVFLDPSRKSSSSSPFDSSHRSSMSPKIAPADSKSSSDDARESSPSQFSIGEHSPSLSSQLEATRIALEAQQVRVQELEANLMLEREARLEIEDKYRAMEETRAVQDDDDAASRVSDETVTHGPGEQHVPHGMDELSDSNGHGEIPRLENLLRTSQEELETWRARAEVAESESAAQTARIFELTKDLKDSRDALRTTRPPSKSASRERTSTPNKDVAYVTSGRKGVDKAGRGPALVGMVAVVMFGLGVMSFIHNYAPKKEF